MTSQLWLVIPLAGALSWLLWFTYRYAWFRPSISFEEPRILMYHMIRDPIPGARFNKMRVRPKDFRAQVEWLVRDGWTFCFLSEIIDERGAPAEKRVVLTFDDGFRDNFLHALPILREFNVRGTLFPVIDRRPGFDWSGKKKAKHAGGELGRERKLSDDEIREMLGTGLIELGGHSRSHANLPSLSDDEAWEEISGCRRDLEEKFGVDVKTFCYPFGLFGAREVELVQKAGFIGAVTTKEGVGARDPLRLPRVKISGKEGLFGFRLRMRTGVRGWSAGSKS